MEHQGDSAEGSEEEKRYRKTLSLLRHYLIDHDSEDFSDEVLHRNQEQEYLKVEKGSFQYKVAKNFDELCPYPRTLWKAGLKNDEPGYLAEEISSSSVQDAVWLLWTAYGKM